jgi:uncharacterized ParB-like nuclease family protein
MTTTIEPGHTGELPAVDLGGKTRNLTSYMTPFTGAHRSDEMARPSGYVGRHRAAANELSTYERVQAAQRARADADRALREAVA